MDEEFGGRKQSVNIDVDNVNTANPEDVYIPVNIEPNPVDIPVNIEKFPKVEGANWVEPKQDDQLINILKEEFPVSTVLELVKTDVNIPVNIPEEGKPLESPVNIGVNNVNTAAATEEQKPVDIPVNIDVNSVNSRPQNKIFSVRVSEDQLKVINEAVNKRFSYSQTALTKGDSLFEILTN